MGLLDGTIPRHLILGITANSVFMNQVFGYWNSVKGCTSLLIKLYQYLGGNFFPVGKSANHTTFQRLLDIVLRFYPVSRRRDICTSAACHRASFGFADRYPCTTAANHNVPRGGGLAATERIVLRMTR